LTKDFFSMILNFMADQFLLDQITAIEAQITALNAALLFLSTNPHKSYTLDTGQTRQEVSRDNIKSLQNTVDQLLDSRATLQARCNGASQQIRPAW